MSCNKKKYTASVSATGSALTDTEPTFLVTSTASATVTSNVSYQDAYKTALTLAQDDANSVAENDANVITQAVDISKISCTGNSQSNNTPYPVNAFTVNMQVIDRITGLTNGPTGVYYAPRVSTDGNGPIYSNIRMSAIQLG
jgi:hypothetical protein